MQQGFDEVGELCSVLFGAARSPGTCQLLGEGFCRKTT